MKIHILTLFPETVKSGLSESVIGRAQREGLLSLDAVDIRDYTHDKHRKVDDYPYGGGAGMLMQAQPVYDAWRAATGGRRIRTVYLTPQGIPFTQSIAEELAKEEELVLLCGHYEGIDERVLEETVTDVISIGDYVLTGGELAAMVLVDAVGRLIPGVLHNGSSAETESFHGNLLEYPQYSRPEEWMGRRVPEALLTGDPKKTEAWRRQEAIRRTRERRPDLYRVYEQLADCRAQLYRDKLMHTDMTELIDRGQAQLVCREGSAVCLRDVVSGIYFHTAEDGSSGVGLLERLRAVTGGKVAWLALHQEDMVEPAKRILGLSPRMVCRQAVYTRREKLPNRGLFQTGGAARAGEVPLIRPLTEEELPFVLRHYDLLSEDDLRGRIERGWLFGAFLGGEPAGFAGMHEEGSVGMLLVLPEFRGHGIAKALETYVINRMLECGYTPYGHVEERNGASMRLQEALGLCFAKGHVYWMKGES